MPYPVRRMRHLAFMDTERIYRAIDANANRAVEGLRVAEDGIRFVLDDPGLTQALRALRHLVRDSAAALPGGQGRLLAARDSIGDVARNAPSTSHADARAIVFSNLKRAQEAVRSLEEFSRTVSPAVSARFGEARFRLYDIEKQAAEAFGPPRARTLPRAPFLYALADFDTLRSDGSFEYLSALIEAGVAVIQLRQKDETDRTLVDMAELVKRRMMGSRALLFINDRADIALAAGTDGVHLGQDDLSPEAVRTMAGGRLLIGVSTHSMKEANKAQLHNPDYISVGAVFESPTKPEVKAVGTTLVKAVARKFDVPVVAIGGITADNAAEVAAAGAAGAAVISDLAGAADPKAHAERILSILKENYRHPATGAEDENA